MTDTVLDAIRDLKEWNEGRLERIRIALDHNLEKENREFWEARLKHALMLKETLKLD